MAEEPSNNLRDRLIKLAESIIKVADTMISPPKDRQADDAVAVPQELFCPLSKVIMTDPVTLSYGKTYDKEATEDWLKSGETICPVTKEALVDLNVRPNHLARVLIREWCKKHNKSQLFEYSLSTPLYIRHEYFNSLHWKLSSAKSSEAQKKEAAKEVRKEATKCPYFRKIYAEFPKTTIHKLLDPLSQSDGNSKIDPQLQQDLITTLMIVSVDDKVKTEITDLPNGIPVLLEALQSDNTETQRNAVLTIFQISSIDSNKEDIGKTDAMVKLATLLTGKRSKLLSADVNKTLLSLFQNTENMVKAVMEFDRESIFKKIEERECVEAMLPFVAHLLNLKEGINDIEKYNCNEIIRVVRESLSGQDKENVIAALFYALRKDGSKWKEMVIKEERIHGTITEISQNGTSNEKAMAKAILDGLKMEPSNQL